MSVQTPTARPTRHRPVSGPGATVPGTSPITRWGPVVLLVLAVGLWIGGLHHIDPTTLGGIGLLPRLSPLTLASYPVLLAAAVWEVSRADRRGGLLALITVAGLVLVYGLQPAVEGVARLPIGWLHAGFANQIADHGQGISDFDTRFSWPGFFAVVALLGKGAGLSDVAPMLNWAPVVLTGLATLGMAALAQAVFGRGDRRAWLATWVFLLGNWTEQDYFSPQGTAFVLLIAALAITVRYLVRPGVLEGGRIAFRDRPVPEHSPRARITAQLLVLLIAVALAPTHQLTPFVLVGVLGVLALWRRLSTVWLPVLALVPAVAWFVLGGREFWIGQLSLITGSIGDVNSSVTQGIGNRLAGDPGHEFVVYLRIGLTVLIAGAALAGWFVARFRGHRTWTLPVLAACSFGLAVLQPYGGEVFLRCYLFALPWFAVGAAVALDAVCGDRLRGLVRPALVWLALVAVAGSTVVARGGNDAYTSITQADLDAMHWIYDRAPSGDKIVALEWYAPLRADRVADLVQVSTEELETGSRSCRTEAEMVSCLVDDKVQYVVVNPQQESAGVILDGRTPGWTGRVVASLEQKGYHQVFDEDGSLVLASTGAAT